MDRTLVYKVASAGNTSTRARQRCASLTASYWLQLLTLHVPVDKQVSFKLLVHFKRKSLNAWGLKFRTGRLWSSPGSPWPVSSQWGLVFEVQQQTPESLYSHQSSRSLWTLSDLPLCSGRLVGRVHSGISIFTLKRQNLLFLFFFPEWTSAGKVPPLGTDWVS